jgi:hypothetical protein
MLSVKVATFRGQVFVAHVRDQVATFRGQVVAHARDQVATLLHIETAPQYRRERRMCSA